RQVLHTIDGLAGYARAIDIALVLDMPMRTVYQHLENIPWDYVNMVRADLGLFPLVYLREKQKAGTTLHNTSTRLLKNDLKGLNAGTEIHKLLRRLRWHRMDILNNTGLAAYRRVTLPLFYKQVVNSLKKLPNYESAGRASVINFYERIFMAIMDSV